MPIEGLLSIVLVGLVLAVILGLALVGSHRRSARWTEEFRLPVKSPHRDLGEVTTELDLDSETVLLEPINRHREGT